MLDKQCSATPSVDAAASNFVSSAEGSLTSIHSLDLFADNVLSAGRIVQDHEFENLVSFITKSDQGLTSYP